MLAPCGDSEVPRCPEAPNKSTPVLPVGSAPALIHAGFDARHPGSPLSTFSRAAGLAHRALHRSQHHQLCFFNFPPTYLSHAEQGDGTDIQNPKQNTDQIPPAALSTAKPNLYPNTPPRLLAAPVIRSGAAPLCRRFPELRVPAGGCNVLFSLGSRTVCPGSLPAILRGAGAGQGVPGAGELLRPLSKPGHEVFIPPVPCRTAKPFRSVEDSGRNAAFKAERKKKKRIRRRRKKEFFWLRRARRHPVSRRDGWHTCAHTHAHACAAPRGGGK